MTYVYGVFKTQTLSRYAKVVGEEVISANDFWRFLSSNHDHVLRHDPTVRAFTYRIIRRLITSARHRSLGLSEVSSENTHL